MINDEVRAKILSFLYELHAKAKSPSKQEIGIQDLQRSMKQRYSLSQPQVSSNLDYLVDRGWVRKVTQERAFRTAGGTMRSAESVKYKISAEGIDHIEGDSQFARSSPYGSINITNLHGVTVIGDRNVVKTKFADVASELEELRRSVLDASLPDEAKVALVNEIETIKLQLAKDDPDPGIVQRAWSGVKALTTVESLLEVVERVEPMLRSFLVPH